MRNKLQKNNKILLFISLMLTIIIIFCSGCARKQVQEQKRIEYTVVDAQGYKLEMEHSPHRIISLSISTDEILLDLVEPERIAALTYLADDLGISNVTEKAKLVKGRVKDTNPEALLALKPDLLLIPDFIKSETIQSLRDMQLPVYVYKTPHNIVSIKENIKALGEVVGENEKANKILQKMEADLQVVRNKLGNIPADKQKRIIFMRDNGAYYSPEQSFNDICYYAKVKNALTELNYSKPTEVAQEKIIELNPDAIILAEWNYDGKHEAREQKENILENDAFASVNAVQNKAVYIIPAKHLLSLSPSIVKAVAEIAHDVYGIDI